MNIIKKYRIHKQAITDNAPWTRGDHTATSRDKKHQLWLRNGAGFFDWYESSYPSIPIILRRPLRRHFNRLLFNQMKESLCKGKTK